MSGTLLDKIKRTASLPSPPGMALQILQLCQSQDVSLGQLADTLAAGAGLCDPRAVEVLVTEGPERVRELVDRGARVKATGFGRTTIKDVAEVLRRIHAVNPEALMFGTDLPGSRARRVFEDADLELVAEALGDGDGWDAVTGGNARRWYRCPEISA